MVRIKESSFGVQAGQEHGKWEVLGKPFSVGSNRWRVVVKCKCGKVSAAYCHHIAQGGSNGCRKCRTTATHGKTGEPLYEVWKSMKQRCLNPRSCGAKNYASRGISLCHEWLDYSVFREWSLTNGYSSGLQIDRIDNDGNYEPGNCRWTTRSVNQRNKRTNHLASAFGESKCLAEWAEDERCMVSRGVLWSRMMVLGWEPEKAIATPAGTWGRWGLRK